MASRRRLILITGVVLAGVASVVAIWRWSARSRPVGSPPANFTRTFDRPAQRVPGLVLVNDMPDARLATGVPIYVQAVLRNAGPDPIPLAAAPALTIALRRDDRDVVATVTRLGAWPALVPARGTAVVTWRVTDVLEAGVYEVGVTGDATWSASAAHRAVVSGARLEISPTADADQAEAAAIRLLMLDGNPAAALARLDAALVRDGDGLLWQLWRADALESLGRKPEAAAALARLGAAVTARQKQAGRDIELPFWLAQRLAESRR